MRPTFKSIIPKKPDKDRREKVILFHLVELYLNTGKPIGSQTLKESGLDSLSSATIRNYFSKLEEMGYLKQQHSSGGRIPTPLAYQVYVEDCLKGSFVETPEIEELRLKLSREMREVQLYLQQSAEVVSSFCQTATFLSFPRLEHDLILDIRLVSLDTHRCLCAVVTDFGMVQTEVLYTDKKMSQSTAHHMEEFFQSKIQGGEPPHLSPEELHLAQRLYQEIILRYLTRLSTGSGEHLYRTGFSKLLHYPEFNEAAALSEGLSWLESPEKLHPLIEYTIQQNRLVCSLCEEETLYLSKPHLCVCLTVPYFVQQIPVGALGIIGPHRLPYKKLISLLHAASRTISETLTRSLYKFKISFEKPSHPSKKASAGVGFSSPFLIENQR